MQTHSLPAPGETKLQVKEVESNGIIMLACKDESGTVRVGVRSICDGLGIAYNAQMERIGRDDVLPEGVRKIRIPTNQGIQEANMLDINFLPFFLVGIKASMCRTEVQSTLKEFKVKAKDVLAAAFITQKPTLPADLMNDPIIALRYEQIQIDQRLKQVEADQDDLRVQAATAQEQALLAHRRINDLDAIDIDGTPQQQLGKKVRRYAEKHGLLYAEGWRKFREAYNITYNTNIKARLNNYMNKNGLRSMTLPEYLVATGQIEDGLRVADRMLTPARELTVV